MRVTTGSIGLLGLAMLDTANASPTKANIVSELRCLVVDLVVDVLHNYSSATPFCSSFLQIPTITSTATATSSVPTTTVITTTTGTNTITADTVTSTETSTVSITTCILSAVEKRGALATGTPSASTHTSSLSIALPSCVATFANSQISTACSCLSIPTPSTTVTNTVTVTPIVSSYVSVADVTTTTPTTTITVTSTATDIVCPTPTQCGNQGIQWAEYTNNQGNNDDSTYSQFDPTVYKSEVPNASGVTSTAGGIDASGDEEISVYGSSEKFYSDYFVLDHRGYLFAEVSGTYTISVSRVDDTVFLWYGANAYSGWKRSNANLIASYTSGVGPGSGSTTVDLVEGEYLPMRIMFAQGQGNAIFQLTIAAPDGTIFLDSSTANSPYLLQYSCDNTTAPAFSAWGSES